MTEPKPADSNKSRRGAIATEAFAKIEVSSVEELDAWLEANHESDDSVWLVTFKKHVSDRHITMEQTLDTLISHGWIDGLRRNLDDDRTMQLISKRRQQKWSQSYKDRLARLTAAGTMRPWGMAAADRAKREGTWNGYAEVDALNIPDDLRQAFAAHQSAAAYFDACGASYRRNVLRWIAMAKRDETRRSRITKVAGACAKKDRMPQM